MRTYSSLFARIGKGFVMAQQGDYPRRTFESAHLRRYLPSDLAEAIANASDSGEPLESYQLEAFIHLAAARYTVTTYMPRLVAHQLLHERLEAPWLREIQGSLLFADLSGSTALAEHLSALGREGTELVTSFLNDIFGTMIQVIESFGGDLISFGGDALLVFFGDERHPRTAGRAALALQQAIHGYTREVAGIGSFPMHLHIGVESGPVLFASAGLEHARHCWVLGETVNRVALAEGQAGPSEVVAGPRASAALEGFVEGQQVAPGFLRLHSIAPPVHPHLPAPEEPPLHAAPAEAIPILLDALSRVSAYIPPVVLERILADPQLPQIEADLRPVSVLFAQVLGLEAAAQQLPAAVAAEVLQRYVAGMQEAVELFGGVVNKLDVADQGLKLVAIFGAPTAYEDHAERAALAALEMQERLGALDLLALDAGVERPQFQQRIGLNLGTVFAGNVGSPSRKEYTVMGDAVNVAARVMTAAAWGEVWCSEALSDEIVSRLVCEARGAVRVKGKAQPLPLYQVSARRDSLPNDLLPVDGPLIGRERELVWLRKRLSAAKTGHGRALRITGDAGVGKSRLVAALIEDARAAGFRFIPATSFSYTSGIPYAAWGELLKALCGIVAGDGNAQRIRKLGAQLEQLGPGMEEWLPLLSDLARLDVPENRLTRGLDPKLRQTQRFELLEQLLLRAADDGPVLALFEDLHWADPISLELWQRVANALSGHAVLLVGVHRGALDLPTQKSVDVLQLAELSAEESSAMVATLSGASQLPDAVLQQIVNRAEGNPLFLNELLRAVVERQAALDDLPDSLNGLLLARIDRLDESSRSILRVASVIGQRIPFGVLRSLQPTEHETLVRQLVRLDEQEMTLVERLEPERVHIFRHALIQEVAYQSILYARRRELHGRIGAYLERRYAGDMSDYIGLLAHHYRLSDRHEKAIEYLVKAGHAASTVYANEEAIQQYRWALEALNDEGDPRKWEAYDALGEVFATIGRYDEALAQHAAIIAAPGATPDLLCRAHRKRGSALEKQGQYAAALAELEQARQLAQDCSEEVMPLANSMISADIALVYKRQGDYDRAIAACESGLNSLRRDPRTREDEQIEARLHSELGGIYGMRGDYPRSRQHFEHSLHIREMIDDLPGLTAAHNNLGYLWQLQGEYEQAIEHYAVAEEIARKINLRFMLVFADLNTAYALTSLCRYDEARIRCDEALKLSQEMSDRRNVAQAFDTSGLAAFHQGDYTFAQQAYEDAIAIHRDMGSTYQEGSSLANFAFVLNAQQRYDEALVCANQALQLANEVRGERLKAESLNGLAEAHLGLGNYGHAQIYAQESIEIARRIQSRHDEGIAQRLLALALAAEEKPFSEPLSESVRIFEATKDTFEQARTRAAHGFILASIGRNENAQQLLKEASAAFMSVGANGELQRVRGFIERSA